MPKSKPSVKWVEPGYMAYYSLDELTRRRKNAPLDQWGICAAENTFWIGAQVNVGEEGLLQLPLLEILDRREAQYSELGDEEVYLFIGREVESGTYKWFLMEAEEAKSRINGPALN